MTRRGLVIGYGSIGERHARVLETLGFVVSVVSRRGESGGRPVFTTLVQALDTGGFETVVIANETARHAAVLEELAASGYSGFVLVEKPLFADPAPMPIHEFRGAGVGYNLRFHPVVQVLRNALAGRVVQMANLYVGQHFADWRPGRNPADVYSASREAGGGVLRDLSHELDLISWLLGPWRRVAALGGRLGNVTVDADDGWGIILSCAGCPVVTVELNGLDRCGRRAIIAQAEGETLLADLIAGTLQIGNSAPQVFAVERDMTYIGLHQAFLAGSPDVCSFEQGTALVDMITSIERAALEKRWIDRSAA